MSEQPDHLHSFPSNEELKQTAAKAYQEREEHLRMIIENEKNKPVGRPISRQEAVRLAAETPETLVGRELSGEDVLRERVDRLETLVKTLHKVIWHLLDNMRPFRTKDAAVRHATVFEDLLKSGTGDNFEYQEPKF